MEDVVYPKMHQGDFDQKPPWCVAVHTAGFINMCLFLPPATHLDEMFHFFLSKLRPYGASAS